MIAFAVPALFTGLSFYWLKLSDRYFLLRYQGKSEVGLYTVASSLAQPLMLVLMAFRMAWPQWHYSKLEDESLHKHLVARSSTYFISLNAAILVAFGIFLPLLTHVLLNERYWSVTRVTFVLAVSIVLYGVYFIFWVGANVAKKNRMVPVFFVIASAANIALNFAFVPEYGMWAAAWSAVAGYAILAGTIYFYSRRYYAIPYEWRRLLTVAGATVLSLAAVAAIGLATGMTTAMPLDDLVLRTALAATAFVIFPGTLALAGFFTPGERRRMGDAWRSLRGGGGAPPAAAAEEVFELEEAFETAEEGGTAT
jgi:O-antigen/teichoic acid export membrane protein